jgi:hypothetical protein
MREQSPDEPRSTAEHLSLADFATELRRLRRRAGDPTYQRLQKDTGFGRTVLSEALNGKKLPTWPVTERLVRVLGEDPERWRPRWAAVPRTADALPPDRDVPTTPDTGGWRRRFRRRRLAVAATVTGALVVVGGSVATGEWLAGSSSHARGRQDGTAPGPSFTGARCMEVTARDVRVFTAERGEDIWTRWKRNTRFWIDPDATAGHRYQTLLRNGQHGWVTDDGHYVTAGRGCP